MSEDWTRARRRNWCGTFYKEPIVMIGELTYMVYQKEQCPTTHREHWQAYMEFSKKFTMKGVKEYFNDDTIHLEGRKGTQAQAREYCMKVDTKMSDPVEFGVLKKQGKRSDIDDIYEDIEKGDTLKEILMNHKGNALRMVHAVEKGMMVYHGFSKIDRYINAKRIFDAMDIRTTNGMAYDFARERLEEAERALN